MTFLAALASTLRGLATRAGAVVTIFVVAVVAVAAATASVAYYTAAQTSILRDTVRTTTVLGRGYDVVQTGPVSMGLDSITTPIAADLGSRAGLFTSQVQSLDGTAFEAQLQETLSLVWRTGVCSHLEIEGACPEAAGQVIVSQSLAALNGWHPGQRVAFPTWGTLTLTGVYTPPPIVTDYWFDSASAYFPVEYPPSGSGRGGPGSEDDAMFTARSTLANAPPSAQGAVEVDAVLNNRALTSGDVRPLSRVVTNLVEDPQLTAIQAVVTTEIPATMTAVSTGWSSLAIPVLLITLQLLGLAWLLLFLLVTEAVVARGPEVALAKLRGYGRWRTIAFGLSEPAVLLTVALPVGAMVGWAATVLLGHALLLAGTEVGLPAIAWAAAGVATAGGLAAVVGASQRTLRRPVVEQWRRSSRHATDRTWIVDAMLLTGAAGGLGELVASGTVTSAHQNALSLLVPGLLGAAVAVVASRVLPLACSAAIGRSRRGSLAAFLALRHVARRPGGSRTTIMLATSFALATFALSAWAVGQTNYRSVADAQLGASTVFTVTTTPTGANLGALVAKADPSGRLATPVEEYPGNGSVTLAVDPAEWNRIAAWNGARLSPRLVSALDPPAPAPLVLDGDAVRIRVTVTQLSPAATGLTLDVVTPTGVAPTPVDFPTLPASGTVTETASLPGCPCTVEDITLSADPSLGGNEPLQGNITIGEVDVHDPTGWQRVDAGLTDQDRWTVGGTGGPGPTIQGVPDGLR